MSLALKKASTLSNIKNGFKACGICLLIFDAMNGKMESTQVFSEKVPLDVQVEEILEHGSLPTRANGGGTKYHVDVEGSSLEEQLYFVDLCGHEAPQETVVAEQELINVNQFLRLP